MNDDWSTFDNLPESTVTCRCGTVYRSHHKLVSTGESFVGLSRKPCPGCGSSTNAQQVSTDPETYTL